jgi:hypothetical protein
MAILFFFLVLMCTMFLSVYAIIMRGLKRKWSKTPKVILIVLLTYFSMLPTALMNAQTAPFKPELRETFYWCIGVIAATVVLPFLGYYSVCFLGKLRRIIWS